MKSLTVKSQLTLAFGVMTLIVLVMSVLGISGVSSARDRFATYVGGEVKRSDAAAAVRMLADQRALAVRDLVLVRSADEQASEKAKASKAHADLQVALKNLKGDVMNGIDATDQDRALVDAVDKVEAAYGPVALAIVQLASTGRRDEAIDKMNNECRPLLASLIGSLATYQDYLDGRGEAKVAATEAASASNRNQLIGMTIAAVLTALALAFTITRRLLRALGAEPAELSASAERVAHGDLSHVEGADNAQPGSVLASMGEMQAQLVGLIGQVRGSAESIATASAEIAQGNNDLSSRTEQQASALEETAASMEQLGSTVRQNADNAKQANQLAQGASKVAIHGGQVVGQVVDTMKGINDSSRQIADIISVIDSIAFQTNILALNAAVEAARAGEQGRGFAVVAGEVRNLAQRSAEAAKQIKSLITTSVERVEQGAALVDKAGETMSEVVDSIKRVTDIMGEISAASAEQSAGVSQVGEAVTQMDRATQQNAALVEQSAAAAESLKAQASQLVQAVAVFKLGSSRSARGYSTVEQTRETEALPTAPVDRRGPKPGPSTCRAWPRRGPAVRKPAAATPSASSGARTGTDDEWTSF